MSEPRGWTDEEIEQVFLGSGDPTVRDLFLFVKQHSFDGQFQSGAAKAQATFNFYVRVRLVNGRVGPRVALEYRTGESEGPALPELGAEIHRAGERARPYGGAPERAFRWVRLSLGAGTGSPA